MWKIFLKFSAAEKYILLIYISYSIYIYIYMLNIFNI